MPGLCPIRVLLFPFPFRFVYNEWAVAKKAWNEAKKKERGENEERKREKAQI